MWEMVLLWAAGAFCMLQAMRRQRRHERALVVEMEQNDQFWAAIVTALRDSTPLPPAPPSAADETAKAVLALLLWTIAAVVCFTAAAAMG